MSDSQKQSSVSSRTESVAPNRLVLLVTIVPKGKGTFFSDFLQQNYGANLQLAIVGTGTARSDLVEFFGLKDNKRSVIFSVVLHNRVNDILGALEDRFRTVNGGTGIAFTVPLSSVIGKLSYAFLSDERRMLRGE